MVIFSALGPIAMSWFIKAFLFIKALNLYERDRAMVVTNSYFNNTAIRLANSNDCILFDRATLLK